MRRVKGIYDGKRIELLEEITLPPNTPVKVVIWQEDEDWEELYWQRLMELGLLKEVHTQSDCLPSFTPVHVEGPPVSQTIIEDRR